MKNYKWALRGFLVSAAFFFHGLAIAEPVSFNIKNAGVQEFCDLVIKGILERDYVIPAGIVAAEKKVSVSIKEIEKEQALDVARSVLASVDVEIIDENGILYLRKINVAAAMPQAVNQAMPGQMPAPVVQAEREPEKNGEFDPKADVEVYWPVYRNVEMLSGAVKLAGAKLVEQKEKTGALVFAGRPEVTRRALDLLSKLDRPAAAVNVKAVVMEYTDSNEKSSSFQAVLNAFEGRLGLSLDNGIKSTNAVAIASGSLKLLLSALEGDSRFKYVAEPSLRVLDGEKGKITVGQEVPTRGQVTYDAQGNSMQSIVYKTAGVMLELSPRIYEDSIQMTINQQISSFAQTTTSGIDSPTVMKRDLSTVVDAKSGDVIVLAGMDESREISTNNGFSWLPSVMKGGSSSNNRSQIILLLEVEKSGQSI